MKRLTLLLALVALPAAAKVKQSHPAALFQVRAPMLRMAPQTLPPKKAAIKGQPPAVKVDPPDRVLDGLTLVELDGSGPRRIVLKPDFRGGPGASFSVKF